MKSRSVQIMRVFAVFLMIASAATAQLLSPAQRTPEEEKQFRERQIKTAYAEIALEACMRKEVERDFALKYLGAPSAIAIAIDTCAAHLERYAFADCASFGKDGEKHCAQPEMRAASIEVRRERQLETWVPVLLKRRVELQPDGPKYLFDFASRFVYAVVAKNEKDNMVVQGSAVAIDDRSLITNCHVVEKATSIALRQGNTQIGANRSGLPVDADRRTDRCILYADRKVHAFATIRDWKDLNVGERVYAIGVPQGIVLDLSLTLSEGILSGKRTDAKHRLIQTTAPISQGSSGGGLFDSSGRLLAITTFTLSAGQNLNFAIAAEDWRYEICMNPNVFLGGLQDCRRHAPVP